MWLIYPIPPNYHTVSLGFSKILGKLLVKYVPTYTILRVRLKKKRSEKDLSNDANAMVLCFFLLIFFIKVYVVGTHLSGYPQHMSL